MRSSYEGLRCSNLMNILMSKDTRVKDKARAVVINTTPLWSLDVIMAKGGESPAGRPPSVAFDAIYGL